MTNALMDSNRSAYDRMADRYVTRELYFAERRLLERFRNRWADWEVLDLGVGAGRTAYTFAALAKSYLGLDYSPRMIEYSRRQVPESGSVRFDVADAADLSRFHDRRFDMILFSYNGIDYVDQMKRRAVLREVRKLLRDKDSHFYFSTHSLHAYPFSASLPAPQWRSPLRWTYRFAREATRHWRVQWANRHVSPELARRRGWALLNDGLHDFSITTHYILPEHQVQQLNEAGLGVTEAFLTDGTPVDWRVPQTDPWIHFLCHPL